MKKYSTIDTKGAKSILRIFFVIIFSLLMSGVYSQNPSRKPSRQSALEAFSRKNYDLAYNQFSALSDLYPKDPLYKYYRGVCLVNLERDPAIASSLLTEAIQGSLAVRSVPSDGLFYLGRAQQLEGKYSDAILTFSRFSEQEGKRTARQMNVPEYIRQCEEHKGRVDQQKVISQEVIAQNNKNELSEAQENISVTKEPLNNVNKKGKEPLPGDYEALLAEALELRFKSDSLSRLAERKRAEMDRTEASLKSVLRTEIQNLEKLSSSNRELAEKKMAEAQLLINKPEGPGTDTSKILTSLKKSTVLNDSVKAADTQINRNLKSDSTLSANLQPAGKTITQKNNMIADKEPITGDLPAKQPTIANIPSAPVFSEFAVNKKPVYKPGEKLQVNPDIPSGLIYRIQVAVFRNPVAPSFFKGMTPVYGFKANGATLTSYYVGMFRRSSDASKALIQVKSLGFKDAFIVAIMDGKPVSLDRAAVMEKEWGSKSLVENNSNQQKDTIPPTLVYRIEIKKSPKPLPNEQVENMRKLGGSHVFDILVNNSKQYIYLIGKFITFKSASEYGDLLVRNGFKEARVVAYLGDREIPVETARQLFEEY
jgi:tetratricopeptide (TPR) repeat protein